MLLRLSATYQTFQIAFAQDKRLYWPGPSPDLEPKAWPRLHSGPVV